MPFLTNKKFVFVFNWEILVKKFVDSYLENSWKHVVNSIKDILDPDLAAGLVALQPVLKDHAIEYR